MKNKTCGYCGVQDATTKDHVVPKCLFKKPMPNNVITIPSCEECNKRKSKFDHVLRDIIGADFRMLNHPDYDDLFARCRKAYASKRSSSINSTDLDNARKLDIKTASGIILEEVFAVPIGNKAINAIQWMVRGLYFRRYGEVLNEETPIDVRMYLPEEYPAFNQLNDLFEDGPWFSAGDIVKVKMWRHPEIPTASLWLILFYDGIPYAAYTDRDKIRED